MNESLDMMLIDLEAKLNSLITDVNNIRARLTIDDVPSDVDDHCVGGCGCGFNG